MYAICTHSVVCAHTSGEANRRARTRSRHRPRQRPRARTARVAGRPARRRTACRVAGAADSCTAKQRPEAPSGTDNADHCRQPRLDRRESSTRVAGRAPKVAGAGSRKARALTAAQPEASSAAPQQPRRRSRAVRSEAAGPDARGLHATTRLGPPCVRCTAPSSRVTSSGRGWLALRHVAAEDHQIVS